jgi:hypothetical protein
MAEMWGLAGGIRNFNQDQMQLQKLALDQQEAKNLEVHRRELRSQASAEMMLRERKLSAEEAAAKAAEDKRALLAQPGEGEDLSTPTGMIKAFRERSTRLLALGDVDEAAKLSNVAAQTLGRLEAAANSESLQRTRDFELAEKKTRRMQELLTGVRSQADLDRARLVMMNDETLVEEAMHPSLQKFDPKTISAMLAGSPALMERLKLQRQQADDASKKALRDARIAYMGEQKKINERQIEVAEAREARLEKAGVAGTGAGGGGPAPTAAKPASPTMRTDVLEALKSKGLASTDAGMRRLQITSLAEDAYTLAQNNRAIRSFPEAIEMAIAGAQQRGELSAATGILGKPYGMFKQQPGSPARPINVKQGDKIEFKEGNHYRDPKGTVVRFENGAFIPVFSANPKERVQPTTPIVPNNPLLDDEEDDE